MNSLYFLGRLHAKPKACLHALQMLSVQSVPCINLDCTTVRAIEMYAAFRDRNVTNVFFNCRCSQP